MAAEVNPRQKATVITAGRPLSDLLQHYANKYQVVFAIEDSRSLWVTSPEMYRLQDRLYVLPLSEKSLEEWTDEVSSLMPINPATNANMLKLIPTPMVSSCSCAAAVRSWSSLNSADCCRSDSILVDGN